MVSRSKSRRAPKVRVPNIADDDISAVVEMLASLATQNSALENLIDALFDELARKRPRDDLIAGYSMMLTDILDERRIAANGGDITAAPQIERARRAFDGRIAKGAEPAAMLIVARIFVEAGLDPGSSLQNAMQTALEAKSADTPPGDPAEWEDRFEKLAAIVGHDPFAIHAEMATFAAALPLATRGFVILTLAKSKTAAAREAAAGFLLAADAATGDTAARALLNFGADASVSAAAVARLVRIRSWLPEARRGAVDLVIRSLRRNADAPAPERRADVRSYFASFGDGAGAKGVFAIAKRGQRFVYCSILLKWQLGVVDTLVRDDLTKREIDGLIARTKTDGAAYEVSRDFVERRLADALALNLVCETPPPFGLVEIAETLSLGPLHPKAIATASLVHELLDGLPAKKTDNRAALAAHRRASKWARQYETVASWFEAGEEIERLLAGLRSRDECLDALLNRHLPARREFWAAQCAWAAAVQKEGADGTDMFESWIDFALVARDLAGDKTLAEIQLMKAIADATLDARHQRAIA